MYFCDTVTVVVNMFRVLFSINERYDMICLSVYQDHSANCLLDNKF